MAGLNKYQAYPEYRDSGMEWCNELPLNWKKTKLRWLSNIFAGGTPSKNVIDYWENGTVPWISSGAVNQGYIVEPSTYISNAALENSSAKWIPKGALVVALAGQGKTKGMVAQLGINTTCNQSMAAIVLYKKNQSRYIFWWLISNYQNIRNMAGGDLRDGLNLELLGDIQCPKPRNDESSKIALFLDHETAKIDNLIEKQQQLIELLKEKRQAVISHAVTKGLNPDVPMKDSGVEWLGEIPNNWITIKLKFITTLRSEKIVLPHTRYVGLENISSGDGSFIVTTDITPESTSLLFEKDDILFGKLRPYLAKAWLATFSGVCSSEFLVLKVEKLNPKYLNYFILSQTFIKQVDSSTYGTKMPRANWEDIGQLPIPLCSYEESKKIAMYLDKLTANLDILKEQQLHQIELLKERRTALISAAVTGKIDLRNWTAPIPEAETPTEVSA
ncbi:restriction endonuclease subunit S [Escherichia coli]|uniref:Restriction endonuclease subunit S n=1 Tax=Escherichia coli TaxID=562 RepID=A0A6D0FZF8_ECOLX|nr:restriction endonuclease subunit S [Escherichia coli]EMA2217655.1 restriction endonuclease subunit S [Escherichia coli]KAE9732703.1 restriction endonuclease subunit S [Escherichia coli]KAE9734771.1 restriction endonuclease subunit S [Escherichia coli]MVV59582.1 restriction endonuclease subunit S [Escherichia coli]MVV66455.1 restriction endonuclease subunit S [Escherichia coli]